MRGLLLRWFVLVIAVLAAAYLVDGIDVMDPGSAFLAAGILGILNAVVRPLFLILTFPLAVLTLGFFIFVINAVLLTWTSRLVPGFLVTGFGPALWGSIVISLVSGLLSLFVSDKGRFEIFFRRH